MAVDERTSAHVRQLLNLVRHDNISGVATLARRIETESPKLGIRLESEGGSVFLCYGSDRAQILREGPRQAVRYEGEFGSEIGTQQGRPQRVRIERETIVRLAAYVEDLTVGDRAG